MKSSTKYIVALALLLPFFLSCETNQEKREKKEQEIKTEARKHNCITLEEFNDYKYSYVYEEKLPKRVYFEYYSLYNIDIVNDIDTKECKLNKGEGTNVYDWLCKPSERYNYRWIVETNYNYAIYVGLTESQFEYVKKHISDRSTINFGCPVILQINQVAITSPVIGLHVSYIADLVEILDEEKEK